MKNWPTTRNFIIVSGLHADNDCAGQNPIDETKQCQYLNFRLSLYDWC